MSAPRPPTELDPRTQALLRLQASRERIQRSMQPDHEGPVWHWLEHPFRFLRRWWRRMVPAFMAGVGVHAGGAASTAHGASGAPGQASFQEAGEAVISNARNWVRQHPVASVGLAAALGALLIGKRGMLWGLLLGVGQGVMRQGQGWLLRRLSDPAMYMAIIAALAARPEEDKPAEHTTAGAENNQDSAGGSPASHEGGV